MKMLDLTVILQSTISLLLLVWIVFRLWPASRLDHFRQGMFALRDELFMFALSGKIAFNHPAHRLLRQYMNGYLRYAHHLSLFQLAMRELIRKVDGEPIVFEWEKRWQEALLKIGEEDTRKVLESFRARAEVLVFNRVVTGSPLLIMMAVILGVAALFHLSWTSLSSIQSRIFAEVIDRLFDKRALDDDALRAAAC